jgi:enediyne biosynthesis protein E4
MTHPSALVRVGKVGVLAALAASVTAAVVATGCSGRARGEAPAHSPAAAGVRFESVAAASGIKYRWPKKPRPLTILATIGCGCAFFDYDNDGRQDILLVGEPDPLLYRNQGNGRFEDVTRATGLRPVRGAWKGCAVGDYDGDGFQDVLLTGYHCLALLKNERGRRWSDQTASAGFDRRNRGRWGSSAGFMDLDADGNLDLVLLNYAVFGPDDKQHCESKNGLLGPCPPWQYQPEFPELWQNLGQGRFKEVTMAAGVKDTTGTALAVAFADDDGRMDFYIGNDTTPADLMVNRGRMRFRNDSVPSGVAYGPRGRPIAAMCADWDDYDRDGRLDLVVTAFAGEAYCLLRNQGGGRFQHAAEATGLAAPTLKPLGFGGKWLDFDNDRWPDLAFANGHVEENAVQLDPQYLFREPLMLFHNQQGRTFQDLVPVLGGELAAPILGRGSATGDYDNDGRVDLLVVDHEGEPLLLHNLSQTPNHWLKLDLRSSDPNRFAYGARVTARAGEKVWVGQVSPASSYQSSSDPRIHFGLGGLAVLETLTIRWPSGRTETMRDVRADQILVIREGRLSHR